MEAFDTEQRWPGLFHGMTQMQREIVLDALALGWHEGNEPTRRVTRNLTDYVRGDISEEECLVCGRV